MENLSQNDTLQDDEKIDAGEATVAKQPAKKFSDPYITAKGEERGFVDLTTLETLWINTGTLCNIECVNCYIESSPYNDRLVYITHEEVLAYLDEIKDDKLGTKEIGITGGEPFMNRDIIKIITSCLERGFNLIVLTNAMRPMMRFTEQLLALHERFGQQLTLRISVDHYSPDLHEEERGPKTWEPMLKGLTWLSHNNFNIDIAGRTRWGEDEATLRAGYAALFAENDIHLDASSHKKLVLFPEMEPNKEVPEITTECWSILDVDPKTIMCANSRMVVKRKGADKPAVIACTLLPYDDGFEFASTLKDSSKRVQLNHSFCSKFCVLGGGSCSVSD
ncbi:MAG: radical SAM protein [Hyphomicrobiales bacterium]